MEAGPQVQKLSHLLIELFTVIFYTLGHIIIQHTNLTNTQQHNNSITTAVSAALRWTDTKLT